VAISNFYHSFYKEGVYVSGILNFYPLSEYNKCLSFAKPLESKSKKYPKNLSISLFKVDVYILDIHYLEIYLEDNPHKRHRGKYYNCQRTNSRSFSFN